MGVGQDHLNTLYAKTSDPWGFEHSDYEQAKFVATCEALSRRRYACAFELGCGNGQLARHLVDMCDSYIGMDAVSVAVDAARMAVPTATFVQDFYPCPLPASDFDLLVLSEILYFFDENSLRRLAVEITTRWPESEVLCVTWLGETGNDLQGEVALNLFSAALASHEFELVVRNNWYRIDRGLPRGAA